MSNSLPTLQLARVLHSDAEEIIAARSKAGIIHKTRDIDAAGDEVEQTVRRVLRRKLPATYYVGHGHIVDSKWDASPQLDVVIADNRETPILFQGENGTEYFPYEAVYAFGEVKTTYYKGSSPIESFVGNLVRLRSTLVRAGTPPTYSGVKGSLGGVVTSSDPRPSRNPLFSFIFFAHANDFKIDDIAQLYSTQSASELPTIVCFLDQGVLINAGFVPHESGAIAIELKTSPEFKSNPDIQNHWTFLRFNNSDKEFGANFGYFYYALLTHLRSCILMSPDMLSYFSRVFQINNVQKVS